MSRYLTLFCCVVSFIVLISLSGCSGCSPSGRRSHQEKSSTRNHSTKVENRRQRNQNTKKRRTIRTTREVLPLSKLYNKYKKSVFFVYTSNGSNKFQGSGFFISKSGLAISNYHVFEGTSQGLEVIKTLDGKQFKIKEVLEKSKENDYIIFMVNIGGYSISNPIPVVSQSPEIGEDVFAIGNPKGLENTLSKGIVSAFRDNNTLIQTTTEITHGSSGGPLINMRGEVIGITTAGLGEANLNFAINIKSLKLYRFQEKLMVSSVSRKNKNESSGFMSVKKVVDGDTFWADDGSEEGIKIRFIGIDAPESRNMFNIKKEYFGKESKDFLTKFISGKKVRLESDVDSLDCFGRTLSYVFLEDGTFVNAEIIRNGFAVLMTVPPNVKYSKYFTELQNEAREYKRGLWK